MAKKKKSSTPRRKRYKREQRLQNARDKWLLTADIKNMKNIAKSYGKWYGVDLLCAIKELEMLGYTFGEAYKEQVKQSRIDIGNHRKQRKLEKEEWANYWFYFEGPFLHGTEDEDEIEVPLVKLACNEDLPF